METPDYLTDYQFAKRLGAKLLQLSNATEYLRNHGRNGTLTETGILSTLTVIERLHHEIETDLGCRTAGYRRGNRRLCDHVPGWLQRRCPWTTCKLGGGRRQGPAASTGVGNADRSPAREKTQP